METAHPRTVHTRLRLCEEEDLLLCRFADRFGRDLRRLNRMLDRGTPLAQAKRQLILEGLTARHFNSIASVLKGKRESRKASLEREMLQKERRRGAIEERLALAPGNGGYSPRIAHQKKRVRDRLRAFLTSAPERTPSLIFGGRKLWNAQHHLAENGFSSHAQWKEDWQEARSGEFFLLGSHDESFGNQSCQLFFAQKILQVRLPDALGGAIRLSDVTFTYGSEVLTEALARGIAISYRFVRKKKGTWYLYATASLPGPDECTSISRGTIGIDLGADRIALVDVDRQGNPLGRRTYRLPLRRKSKTQSRTLIQEVAKDIGNWALCTGKPVVLEDLEFEEKKAALREEGKGSARGISSFAYHAMREAIRSRCARSGVRVIGIPPAHTSTIGVIKFASMYGLSGDEAAALALARRAMNFKELPPAGTARGRPEDRPRHVWSQWRQLGKALRQVGRHAFISATRGSGGRRVFPALPARASPGSRVRKVRGPCSISGGSARRES